jgi:hypothetical protein
MNSENSVPSESRYFEWDKDRWDDRVELLHDQWDSFGEGSAKKIILRDLVIHSHDLVEQ